MVKKGVNPKYLHYGQKVTYIPDFGDKEIGMVKSISKSGVFVVYYCAGRWKYFDQYTAALTDPADLIEGWDESAKNFNAKPQ